MPQLIGSLSEWRRRLRNGEVTPVELVDIVCDAVESRDKVTNAYLYIDRASARAEAEKADVNLPLGGLPVGIKDNINVAGHPCTCASKALSNYVSTYDATVIKKLRESGAVPLGKMNMDEFAMGSHGTNSFFGKTLNPNAPEYVPGGSSSGSAAAVADGTALAALGSDTGGSIRQPAGHCGIVGLKPTYGRISRYGVVAFASSLDQVGTLTQNVEDAALMLNALSGCDEADSTSLDVEVPDFASELGKEIKGMKIGLPKEYFVSGNDKCINEKVDEVKNHLASLGAELVEISMPHTDALVSVYYILACAEASSNLARFDGIRYGFRSPDTEDVMSLYKKSRSEGFGKEVKKRVLLGTYALSSGYYDAYYKRAQQVRTLINRDYKEAFEKVDLVLCPTSSELAPKFDDAETDPLRAYLADIYTLPANLAGLPGISVPCGYVEKGDAVLPIGFQLFAPHLQEQRLLQAAYAYEQSAQIKFPNR